MEKTLKIDNCLKCPNHEIIDDGDPFDSFNRDDCAVICKLTKNPKKDPKSNYRSDRQDFRCVTSSCRPYQVEKESTIPTWCPL